MTRRFVRMFKPRFAALVRAGTKKQTIRPTPKRMPKPGDIIDCREWTAIPRRSKQIKIGEFEIQHVATVNLDGGWIIVGERVLNPKDEDRFAHADGFKDHLELVEWFEREHSLPFTGILISW